MTRVRRPPVRIGDSAARRHEISASEFKMRCLRLVDDVHATGQEYVITKHGKPVALVSPIAGSRPSPTRGRWKAIVRVTGDIVHSDWSDEFDATN